jgi:membrane-bound lytic murein transglycosylase B
MDDGADFEGCIKILKDAEKLSSDPKEQAEVFLQRALCLKPKGNRSAIEKTLAEAVRLDPSVEFDPDHEEPDLTAILEKLKAKHTAAPPAQQRPDAAPSVSEMAGHATSGSLTVSSRLLEEGTEGQKATLASVLTALERPADAVGDPLTRDEFVRFLDDPRANDFPRGIERLAKIEKHSAVSVVAAEKQSLTHTKKAKKKKKSRKKPIGPHMNRDDLEAGARFLQDQAVQLQQARSKWGVDPADITASLMWASGLGKNTGSFRAASVLISKLMYLDIVSAKAFEDAGAGELANRADQIKRRAKVEQDYAANLVALLRYCKKHGMDALELRSSWYGTIGVPQFAATSLRFAQDGDGDGNIDLQNTADAIASVASYLSQNGYRKNRRRALTDYGNGIFAAQADAYARAIRKVRVK